MRASADRDEPRIGLLTPGAFSETYFEHATLARYLGFLLVEGDDLAVSGDRIHIRTVAGLKRLDVLLRRVDSNFLDPLELDASSHLGVPGLIDVLRKNGVVVANMPGSGVLEARALLGFLPSLARRFLDARSRRCPTSRPGGAVRNLPARKCCRGSTISRSRAPTPAPSPAFRATVRCWRASFRLPSATGSKAPSPIAASTMSARNWCGCQRRRYGSNGHITPRPFVLRVFAAARPDGGWTVLPGGFCRIAEQPDARAVSMGDGARSADVWVVSDKAVSTSTLLPAAETVRIRRIAGVVPSRAADNLFWLGRYLERAEATLRLIRVLGAPMRDPVKGTQTGRRPRFPRSSGSTGFW